MQARSVALRLLMHYVGDIHQPLHVTEHYNDQYRTGDLGGNLVKLNEKFGISNLHQAWDSALYQFVDEYKRPLNYDGYSRLSKTISIFKKEFGRKFMEMSDEDINNLRFD